jgi:hypothetical protein
MFYGQPEPLMVYTVYLLSLFFDEDQQKVTGRNTGARKGNNLTNLAVIDVLVEDSCI